MDRKGWIIIIICCVLLVLNYQFAQKNQKQVDGEGKDKIENLDGSVAKSSDESGESGVAKNVDGSQDEKKDEPHVLVAKVGDEELVKYTFSSFGGGIKAAEMFNEPKVNDAENVILNERGKSVIGALARSYKDFETTHYQIIEKTANSVTYRGNLEEGITVTKQWTLEHGEEKKAPVLKLNISFNAADGKTLDLSKYSITTGTAVALYEQEQTLLPGWFYYEDGDYSHEGNGDFTGGWFSDKSPVTNLKVENIEYFGVDNQYFGTAIFPLADAKSENLWASGEEIENDRRWIYNTGLELPEKNLSGGETTSISYNVFIGPKFHKRMGSISENSDDIMHFSRFSFFAWISGIMSSSMSGIHGWFSSSLWGWGYAIVLLTIFIRIIIWPIHNKSTRTMKRMGKLQPLMKDLREKYKENPQKLNQETMKLYREYGVNPMGGCLPMLLQIPIFLGVFNMINAAVELRGQPFLWVEDLSKPDHLADAFGIPINLLPILMAVTMIIQMRMTPQTGDKLQRRIFMLMPLVFFIFCYNYASALALYWTVQNIVSIGQTWLTQRMPEPELTKRSERAAKGGAVVDDGKPRKKGFMERMAEKLEEAQNQRDAAAGKKPPAKKRIPGQPDAKKSKKRTPKTGG